MVEKRACGLVCVVVVARWKIVEDPSNVPCGLAAGVGWVTKGQIVE